MQKKTMIALMPVLMLFMILSCSKEEEKSERFSLLTQTNWKSDSLLINGEDASGPGGMLEKFKGEADFRANGTGTFGAYNGKWQFDQGETELVITSDSLPLPLRTRIHELTGASLKVSASFPNLMDPSNPMQIRLTFKGS